MTQIKGADYNKLLKICNDKRVNFDDKKKGQTN